MIDFRPATEADTQRLFEWRNDALTRAMSRNPAAVTWPEHVRWLQGNEETLLIAECEGEPVGTVRLGQEMSWTVAPEHRGKGIGTAMVAAAVPRGGSVAWIKRENVASQRIADKAGFVLAQDGDLQKWVSGT